MKKLYALTISVLFLFLSSRAQNHIPPSVVWQKTYGGSSDDRANAVVKTVDNGFLMVGNSKSNDGDLTGHYGTTATNDAWILKVSSNGTIEWQKNMGGTADDVFTSVEIMNDGGFLCLGQTSSTDIDAITNHGAEDLFLVRFDRYGNILWKKCLGGTSREIPGNIRVNRDGTIFLIGTTFSNDGDVSGNHRPGFDDIWVVKLSAAGNILWQRCFGGTGPDRGHDILESYSNGFFITIENGSDDGDFGTGNGANPPRGQLLKLDSNFNVVWKTTGSNRVDYLQVDYLTQNGGIRDTLFTSNYNTRCYPMDPTVGGSLTFAVDKADNPSSFSPTYYANVGNCGLFYEALSGNNMNIRNKNILWSLESNDSTNISGYGHGYSDGLLINVNQGGTVVWKKFVGGVGTDEFTSSAFIDDFEFVAAGSTDSYGGQPNNFSHRDAWLVKMGNINIIKGSVFADYNVNGVKDSNEPMVNNVLVQSGKPGQQSSSLTYSGVFMNYVDTGAYTTSIPSINIPYQTIIPASFNSSFSNYYNLDSFSFAMQPIPGKRDYLVDIFSLTSVRPGFDITYKIRCFNIGTDTLQNKQVRLVKDSKLIFTSSMPVQTTINGDTITWTIASLSPRDTLSIIVQLKGATPPAFNFGDTVISVVTVDTTGDLNVANNKAYLWQMATGAFDPNDKQESGGGVLYKTDYDEGKYLNYTIRFQNTGTDTAFNIIVRDTLSTKLDSNSIEMVGVSHPYQLLIQDGKYCTWTFSNIKLVDSNHNEALSHGYISYRIKPKTGLTIGDTIRNSASIYFDFNLPVRTNVQETVLKQAPIALPPQPIVSGISNTYCSNQGVQKGKIENLPTAASGITVTVKLDATTLTVAADSTFSFDVAAISAGPHVIEVVYTNSGGSKTTTINFTSSITVTPEVIISANVTTIINSNPVLITASNASGGGSTPLYTFALDRNFSTIVQAEGSNNVLFLDPALLVGGDNWVYGRMRTSESCYTIQTSVDSIKLVKILPPVEPTISGLSAEYCNTMGAQYGKITNLPATGSGITVEVKLDATVLPVAADSTFTIVPYALSSGAHSVTVKYTNLAGSKTTTHNFTNVAAIMPDVNVSASITNIVNLTVPVIVTATNAAGGGAGPLYTFGKNRDFTALWQAEGSSNTLTITPSTLTVGDNWIYVRMKSNALCISNDIGIDSIKLTRDMSTGITDPDNPGKVISLYPNPFNKQVFISGLSAGKIYVITLTNLNGQLIHQSKISNRTNAELLLPIDKAGTYLLSIHDEKKKLSLGTIKIIKQ